MNTKIITASVIVAVASALVACRNDKPEFIQKEGYVLVTQPDGQGPDLGYSPESGVKIVVIDGLAFKSFSGNDTILPYEDWRLSAEERAADLASRLTREEIAGLMLYSPQNRLPMPNDTYNGKPFEESGANAWDLSDDQLRFLLQDNVRHVLVSKVESAVTAARWNNKVQALAESCGKGIPANNSSDPRHSAFVDAEFAPGADGQLSLWSNLLGLASTFDPEIVREFGRIASTEYRAMGIATALSPQADLATDPRWFRFNATFGNDPKLITDLIKAYCEAFQSTDGGNAGWGNGSVNAMVKHWPGGGTGEGGRDAHFGIGKYAVYPGGKFDVHKIPFVKGAFQLGNPTEYASAVMPYYTISYNQTSENVGNSFNREIITDQLRNQAGYRGVVCTDWIITDDNPDPCIHLAKPWGVEKLTVAERHYKALMAGVDQFGGNDKKQPVLDAWELGDAEHGEEWMRQRMEKSAQRLLLNIFRTGLFENPYLDPAETEAIVGNPEFMERGYNQQLHSVVMLKNSNHVLPFDGNADRIKVYVPQRHVPDMCNWRNEFEPGYVLTPVSDAMAQKYYTAVDNPDEADAAIVFMESPRSYAMVGHNRQEVIDGKGNGYIPISLQYRPYKATEARAVSIAGDPDEKFVNRSYKNKSTTTWNECELDSLISVRKRMGNKPVIVIMGMNNPMVMSEVEPLADAILVGFSVQSQAYLDIMFGNFEPSGLLPFEMPLSMSVVERHNEDCPHDIQPYRDADGNVYDFAYGLNWSGRIADWRTERYGLKQ